VSTRATKKGRQEIDVFHPLHGHQYYKKIPAEKLTFVHETLPQDVSPADDMERRVMYLHLEQAAADGYLTVEVSPPASDKCDRQDRGAREKFLSGCLEALEKRYQPADRYVERRATTTAPAPACYRYCYSSVYYCASYTRPVTTTTIRSTHELTSCLAHSSPPRYEDDDEPWAAERRAALTEALMAHLLPALHAELHAELRRAASQAVVEASASRLSGLLRTGPYMPKKYREKAAQRHFEIGEHEDARPELTVMAAHVATDRGESSYLAFVDADGQCTEYLELPSGLPLTARVKSEWNDKVIHFMMERHPAVVAAGLGAGSRAKQMFRWLATLKEEALHQWRDNDVDKNGEERDDDDKERWKLCDAEYVEGLGLLLLAALSLLPLLPAATTPPAPNLPLPTDQLTPPLSGTWTTAWRTSSRGRPAARRSSLRTPRACGTPSPPPGTCRALSSSWPTWPPRGSASTSSERTCCTSTCTPCRPRCRGCGSSRRTSSR